jgi:hypothetical protein
VCFIRDLDKVTIVFLDVRQTYAVAIASVASTWSKDDAVLELRRSYLDGLKEFWLGHLGTMPESFAYQYIEYG